MKGGVGKTTIAVGLALHLAARADVKVLMIDLDPQSNSSFWICGDVALANLIEGGRTIDAYLEDFFVYQQDIDLAPYVHQVDRGFVRGRNISIIPASPELRIAEREALYFLSNNQPNLQATERIAGIKFVNAVRALRARFDYIIVDTAPGISPLSEAILRACDLVIVPTVPDYISNLGLEAFCRSIWWNGESRTKPRAPWVLANMVRESPHHRVMLREMRAEAGAPDAGFRMFRVEFPNSIAIEEGGGLVGTEDSETQALFDAQAGLLFEQLVLEIDEQVLTPTRA